MSPLPVLKSQAASPRLLPPRPALSLSHTLFALFKSLPPPPLPRRSLPPPLLRRCRRRSHSRAAFPSTMTQIQYLTDITFLRRISGCNEYMVRENFDKMWRWLYLVVSILA
ncbi:hypothetical protein Droror1_Dr00016577 [Drosera rotundifolia]